MPGLDRTGPAGKGSKTGRGLGPCGNKTSTHKNKDEQNNHDLEVDFPRRIRMGRRGAGQGRRLRHKGGQQN